MTGTYTLSQNLIDPDDAFLEVGRIKLTGSDLVGVLERVAKLAKQALPAAEEASVTLIDERRRLHTAAFTGPLALKLDELQYENGHGPCLGAAANGDTYVITDMAADERWPEWTSLALRAGVKSSLAIGIPIQEAVGGALNVYSLEAGAFDEDTILLAQRFISYAVVAVANAQLYDSTVTLARDLQIAMDNRAVIEQAKGIIMADRRCSPSDAFSILAKLSQDSNRKLRDVAAALVESAQTRFTG